LPPLVRTAVFFVSLLHSPDFLLLLREIKSLSIFAVYQPLSFKTFLQPPQKKHDFFFTEKVNKFVRANLRKVNVPPCMSSFIGCM
jgi:hypothetical protein